ncbi:CAP domain-containing protein [Streptomyces misionensis]|uniref:CAP domain-containing protein n=1 Tax=Streptomyces misionensis TaxID=67331 RepID=UPI00396BAF1F
MHVKNILTAFLTAPLAFATAFALPPPEDSHHSAPSADKFCENDGMVLRPKSDFPNTPIGRTNYNMQSVKMEQAILCLVNWDRRHEHVRQLYITKLIGKTKYRGLGGAAYDHATAAAKLRWWGTVAQYPSCTPRRDDPRRCDPHINPQTRSTPTKRAEDAGYGRGCTKWRVGENAYTAWGNEGLTPLDAFIWWMRSDVHRANMRDPDWETMRMVVVYGSADPGAGANAPGATYVQMFGRCWK